MFQRLVVVAWMVSGVACTGTNASYNGQVQGQDFDAADAAYLRKFYSGDTLGTGKSVTATFVVISTSYTMCEDIERQRLYPNEQMLSFVLGEEDTTGLTPLQGQYDLRETGVYSKQASDCSPGPDVDISGGSVTFSKGDYATGGNADADFSVSLESGDNGTGSFSATPCKSMESWLDAFVGVVFGNQQQSGNNYLIYGPCV